MASTGIRIKNIKISLRQTVENRAKEIALKKLIKRIDKVQSIVIKETQKVIVKYIKNSPIIRAIAGKLGGSFFEGNDLQAEFGLTDIMAKKAIDAILEVLKDTVEIELDKQDFSRGVGAKLTLNISALLPRRYREPLLSYGYPLTYISKNFISLGRRREAKRRSVRLIQKSNTINWIKWLLEANRGISVISDSIPDITQYGITYDKHVIESTKSRSGRAIMVKGDSFEQLVAARGLGRDAEGNQITGERVAKIGYRKPKARGVEEFPYKFPKFAQPKSGERNFIEEINNDPQFKRDVKAAVVNALSRYLEETQ